MKENNGKGARRKVTRQLAIVIFAFILLIAFLTFFGSGGARRGSKLRTEANRWAQRGDTKQKLARNQGEPEQWQEKMRNQFDFLSEPQVLELILSAEIHLVDLHVNKEQLLRAPTNSYAGVYGNFCKLDFAPHKQDPSTGMYNK
jgi:hypothetical protein